MSLLKIDNSMSLSDQKLPEIADNLVQFEVPQELGSNKHERQELVCEVTKDVYLLKQYYKIR